MIPFKLSFSAFTSRHSNATALNWGVRQAQRQSRTEDEEGEKEDEKGERYCMVHFKEQTPHGEISGNLEATAVREKQSEPSGSGTLPCSFRSNAVKGCSVRSFLGRETNGKMSAFLILAIITIG